MNMIRVNFIPQELRKGRDHFWQDGLGSLAREVILGVFIAVAGFLLLLHAVLAGVALVKVAQHTILQVRWSSLGPEKKVLDDITNETKALQTRMNVLKVITSSQGIVWARLMNEVSDRVPKGVWIREMRFERGLLVIDGSAVSKARNEMIIVNNFVSALKECPELKAGFISMDVDSIERRGNTALSIADFSLKAKRKLP